MGEGEISTGGRMKTAQHLVGEFKRFGEDGPAYEILRIEDDREATIRVFTSGEELRYPIVEILNHPDAVCLP